MLSSKEVTGKRGDVSTPSAAKGSRRRIDLTDDINGGPLRIVAPTSWDPWERTTRRHVGPEREE
jgi:hypothetical protein